jgi:hypothetical protein
MNRNSALAKAISARTGIRARRIEAWSIEGLGADLKLPLDEQIPHYLELATIAGPGRSNNADLAARRLAAHGFGCSRLRASLLNGVIDESSDDVQICNDLSTEESEDEAFRKYDSIATELTTSVDSLPAAIRLVVRKLRHNAYRGSLCTSDSGEQVFHSAIVSVLHLFNGGEILNVDAVAMMFGVNPSELNDDALEFVEQLKITFRNIEDAYRTTSLEDIVAMAKWLRDHIHVASEYLGIAKASDSILDDLATQFAPIVLCLIEPFVNAFDDFAAFLIEIGVPEMLIPLSSPH